MRIATLLTTVALVALPATASPSVVLGPDWEEGMNGTGDAGSLPSTAQVPTTSAPYPAPLRLILGELAMFSFTGPPDQQDMYQIYISDPLAFYATTESSFDPLGFTTFNSQLFLFDANGVPVVGNDGINDGATIMLPSFMLNPGIYYIAISVFNSDPLDSGGMPLFPDLTGPPLLPVNTNPIGNWTTSPLDGGAYGIALEGAIFVPAPGAIVLFMACPWSGSRRRRRS